MASIEELETAIRDCVADAEDVISGLHSSDELNQELADAIAAFGVRSVPEILDGASRSMTRAVEHVTAEVDTFRRAHDDVRAAR